MSNITTVTCCKASHLPRKVLDRSVSELNFRAIVDGLGEVRFLQLSTARDGRPETVPSCSQIFAAATAFRHPAMCLQVLFQYPFRVPAYYALILRSLTVLEGLALSADPNYKLLGAAYP